MQGKGYRDLQGLIPAVAALCVALLFAVQLALSFGHDEQSHPETLEQVCDYCTVKQSLQDIDVTKPAVETNQFPESPVVQVSKANAPKIRLASSSHSRAPPLTQNT
ncbi:MAG: hypothetical protein AB3N28_12545 [Kordiimonas sp.]